MKSDFWFFIKASDEAFESDLTKYVSIRVSHKSSKFLFCSNDTSVSLKTTDDSVEIKFGHESFGNCQISWSELTSELSVQLDELGLMSVFVHEAKGSLFLSNFIDLLERALTSRLLSANAIHFYCIAGFLQPGTTFWSGIRRIQGSGRWNLRCSESTHLDSKWNEFASFDRKPDVRETVEALKKEIDILKREVRPIELRLSGGADTRVVSFLWKDEIQTVSVQSPWMNDEEDLDVNLASLWAREIGLPHKLLKPSASEFAFLCGISDRQFLTGLYGGEFLGGQFHRVIPSQPSDWTGYEHESPCVISEWQEFVTEDQAKWMTECMKVFLISARSTIYGSILGSWSAPYRLRTSSVSPFCGSHFLKTFLSFSLEAVGNYDFYAEVFRSLGPQLQHVPLSSPMSNQLPHLRPGNEFGTDPKSVQKKQVTNYSSALVLSDLEQIFRAQSIEFRESLMRKLIGSTKTQINLRSLHAWLKPRFL
jgi:hypothetical protein